MTSFFDKAASDPTSMSEKYTGPNYIYSKYIKSPSEMGMSGGGSLDDLANNVAGLVNYMTVLTEGGGGVLPSCAGCCDPAFDEKAVSFSRSARHSKQKRNR